MAQIGSKEIQASANTPRLSSRRWRVLLAQYHEAQVETRETLERLEEARKSAPEERRARRAALVVAVTAAALALAALGSNAAATEALLAQTKASDAWNEFQANSLKRHVNEDTAALLRVTGGGGASEQEALAKADALEKAVREKYRPNQEALSVKAQQLEEERDVAERRHRGFQLAEAALQLAIVLGSVSIVARASWLLGGAVALGAAGVLVALGTALRVGPL